HQRLSGGAGITQQLLSHDSDVRDLQRLKGPTREVELGQRLGLTLTNPVTLTAGRLPNQCSAEGHLTERGNTAGTEATEDGLRPQVLHEVRKGRSLLANERACPGFVSGRAGGHSSLHEHAVDLAVLAVERTPPGPLPP